MTAHPHAAIIKQWAENQDIALEFRYGQGHWRAVTGQPVWNPEAEYRVKEARSFPETRMSDAELLWGTDTSKICRQSAREIANAALRHAIESGQLVEPTEQRHFVDEMTYEKWMKLQARRDMAIAEAVLSEIAERLDLAGYHNSVIERIRKTSLAPIIASVRS